MATVYNWQLGRAMTFPFEEKHPRRQFAFVFNINRCIGCQTCTMACKSTWTFSKGQEYMWWNNVESKPYGGYPQHWDAKLLAMLEAANPGRQSWNTAAADVASKPYGAFEGKTIFEAAPTHVGPEEALVALGYLPSDAEWRHPNIYEDTAAGGRWDEGQHGASAQLPEHRVWFFTWRASATTAHIPRALPPAPARRSISGPRTVSS